MKKALIQNGVVVDITESTFPVHESFIWVDVNDDVGVEYIYENGQFIPSEKQSLNELKISKLAELNRAFDEAAQNAHIMSSVGFEIDANEVANRNIEGLTLVMSDTDTTMFCDYNNEFHEVTRAQLETMRKEIVANSQRLYQIKWRYRSLIEAAATVDELDTIVITIQ